MLIFLDTEFTDFTDRHLISIALVSSDGPSFYGECNDFPIHTCSEFVKAEVLPKLGKRPECIFNTVELGRAVAKWLQQFGAPEKAYIAYDYAGDWTLLCALLGGDMSHGFLGKSIRHQLDERVVRQYLDSTGLPPHHALHDALANRFAYEHGVLG